MTWYDFCWNNRVSLIFHQDFCTIQRMFWIKTRISNKWCFFEYHMFIVMCNYDQLLRTFEFFENLKNFNSINDAQNHINDEIENDSINLSSSNYTMKSHVLNRQTDTLLFIKISNSLYWHSNRISQFCKRFQFSRIKFSRFFHVFVEIYEQSHYEIHVLFWKNKCHFVNKHHANKQHVLWKFDKCVWLFWKRAFFFFE